MPCVDPSHASFVLDPEKNLKATQKRLFPVLEGISSSNRWSWNGVIGEIPSQSFFQGALEKENGLLIYIGHGGAQTCFSRRQIDQMICSKGNQEVRACKASVILMGCSSGRLVSVNRKHSESLEQLPLYFEPEGIALSYLCAGAPCVIGNMWDVTDHDIDR
jgi:separase